MNSLQEKTRGLMPLIVNVWLDDISAITLFQCDSDTYYRKRKDNCDPHSYKHKLNFCFVWKDMKASKYRYHYNITGLVLYESDVLDCTEANSPSNIRWKSILSITRLHIYRDTQSLGEFYQMQSLQDLYHISSIANCSKSFHLRPNLLPKHLLHYSSSEKTSTRFSNMTDIFPSTLQSLHLSEYENYLPLPISLKFVAQNAGIHLMSESTFVVTGYNTKELKSRLPSLNELSYLFWDNAHVFDLSNSILSIIELLCCRLRETHNYTEIYTWLSIILGILTARRNCKFSDYFLMGNLVSTLTNVLDNHKEGFPRIVSRVLDIFQNLCKHMLSDEYDLSKESVFEFFHSFHVFDLLGRMSFSHNHHHHWNLAKQMHLLLSSLSPVTKLKSESLLTYIEFSRLLHYREFEKISSFSFSPVSKNFSMIKNFWLMLHYVLVKKQFIIVLGFLAILILAYFFPLGPNGSPMFAISVKTNGFTLYTDDCETNRYLIFEQWRTDGFGSTIASYEAVLAIAIRFNLLLVVLPMHIDHDQDESDTDRMNFLGINQYDIPFDVYNQCSPTSNVKKHVYNITHIGDYWRYLEQDDGKLRMADHVEIDLTNYLLSFSHGCTVYHRGDTSWWGKGLSISGMQMEQRFHQLHQENPIQAYTTLVEQQETNVFQIPNMTSSIMVAIHIRRGDLTVRRWDTKRQRLITAVLKSRPLDWKNRMVKDETIVNIVSRFHELVGGGAGASTDLQSRLHYTIYSEGHVSDFDHLQEMFLSRGMQRVNIILNGPTTKTMLQLIRADVLFGTTSAFSFSALSMNTHSIRIMPIIGDFAQRFYHSRGILESVFQSIPINTTAEEDEYEAIDLYQQSWTFKNESDVVVRLLEHVHRPYNLQDVYNDSIYPHNRVLGYQEICSRGLSRPNDVV